MTAAMVPGNTAEAFLVHFFGTGLADNRYVPGPLGRRHRSRPGRDAPGEGPVLRQTLDGLLSWPLDRDRQAQLRRSPGLAQVLERIPDCKINRIDELLPWISAPAEDREADD